MAWWKMDKKTGGISCQRPSGAGDSGLINAIPGRDKADDCYGGDRPADFMGTALKRIVAEYKDKWGRPPSREELEGVFRFCVGSHVDNEK